MKLAEKLSEIHNKESDLMRLYSLRESILINKFENNPVLKSDMISPEEIEQRKKEFIQEKKDNVSKLNKKIELLSSDICKDKNKVNKLNVENGVDILLGELKYVRIELSKIMKLYGSNKHSWLSDNTMSIEIIEQVGMNQRIKDLEITKREIDSKIQKKNWSIDFN